MTGTGATKSRASSPESKVGLALSGAAADGDIELRDAGLQVAGLAEETQRALRALLPSGAAVAGSVDTTAMFALGLFRRCLELAGAGPGVDAILALTVTTAASDLVPELCAARLEVTIVAVLDDVEAVRLLPGPGEDSPAVPANAYPESAARALGHAACYGMWRALPPGRVPDLEGVRQDRATELVTGFLASTPDGGWLPLEATVELLGCYGIPLAGSITVTTEDTAVAAAARFSGPVTLRADVPGLLRTTGAGTVPPGLQSKKDDIRREFRSLRQAFGGRLGAVIVQPAVTNGVEVLIRSILAAPLLLGRPGTPPPTSWRCGTCCCESPRWPMSCRRSPSST